MMTDMRKPYPPTPRREKGPVPKEAPEPRWPAAIAILAGGGLYTALPPVLTLGPRWLFPGIVLALLIPTVISHRAGQHRVNAILGVVVVGVLTLGLIISVVLLVN